MSDAAPRDVPLPLPPGWLAKDVTWSRRLADKGKRRAWRWPAWLLARSGDSVFWLALSALALWQGQAMGWRLLWAMVTTAVIVFIVKGIFKRQRPSGHGRDFGADKYAFPSGHAARVEAIEGGTLAACGTPPAGAITRSAPIYVNDEVAALLTLSDVETRFDIFTMIALEQGAAALALELAKRETIAAVRAGVQGDFLTALLNGQPGHVLAARARAAEFPTDEIHQVITAQCGSAAELWAGRATGLAERAGWAVRAAVSPDGQATLVLSGSTAQEWTQSTFLEQLRADWAEDEPLTIAAGDPAFGLAGLQKSLEEARGALALGTRLFGTGGTYVHREMGVYRLLRHLQGTGDLKEFLERTLGALEAYDREHQAELLPTLNVLLAQGGNVSATAKAMHLHRNSVIYRVERIREISGLDPTQAEEAFTLRLALLLAPLG